MQDRFFVDVCGFLISWDAFEFQVADYGAMLALPTEADAFVAQLRQRLADTAKRVGGAFPDNAHAAFFGEELVIRKNSKQAASAALLRVDQQLTARLAPKNIGVRDAVERKTGLSGQLK